ncbi:helix-turn-helix domain-containing protein [Amycolatopsis albispora]|uniref:AraC family transcriptional regulator n=1 Tax=Amycolatopsis albispora TaxID=1804986 RepID=A0A344L5K3_9PSEU|nr:helix-turn-helix domain-containing protein [Amycolatopsis albispora]AXB43327.1 AraC family transcriptional regulator [Amycolatopsis albispora]
MGVDVLWDIARPKRPGRVPGVAMAGFGDRGRTPPGLRLIPHPAVTLLLVLGGTIAAEDTAGRQCRGSFATGLGFGDHFRVRHAEGFECLQVRLSPVVAHAVLGPAAAELTEAVPLDALWGRESARLSEQLSALASWDDRFAWTDAWLARRCAAAVRSRARVAPEVAWAWHRIVAGRGLVRIERLAADLGWSRKRLWSRFQAQLGRPPKHAAKLVRFDHAVHRLVAGQAAAGVAAEGGYADQSHLHRDVVAFTSRTPATVVDEPFLAIDDLAWGWPGPGSVTGHAFHQLRVPAALRPRQ